MHNPGHQSQPHKPSSFSHASPRNYHVFHLVKGHDAWRVIDAQANEVLHECEHEFTARQKVIELAQKSRPSRVVVYNITGKICGSSLYP